MNNSNNKQRLFISLSLLLLGFLLSPSLVIAQELDESDDAYVQAQIADPFIELHTGPGRSFPIFFVAEQGEWITILKSKTTWYKVRLANDKEGWVSKDQLRLTLDVDGELIGIIDPDFQAFLDRDFEVGVFSGDFEGASSISIYSAWHFTQNLSAELSFTQALGSFSEIRVATIDIINEPFPDLKPFSWLPYMEDVAVSPYFGIGVGIIETLPRATLVQTIDRNDDLMFVTVGAKLYLTRRFTLNLEYRNYNIQTERELNERAEEWKIGFSIFF